jgi:diadenylate cyclase
MPLDWNVFTLRTVMEITVLWAAIYGVLRFMRSTRGFGLLRGLASFAALSFLAYQILDATNSAPVLRQILKQVAPSLAIILFILFQPEIRQGLARVGRTGILSFFNRDRAEDETVHEIVGAARRMAQERIGALIAFERGVSLAPFRDSAVALDAQVSGILLENIFFPGSPLHDGAVIVQGDKLAAASCLFPLTTNPEVQRRIGTRHRAAIGLTEETDAITLVVSEESGRISLASHGRLYEAIPFPEVEQRLLLLLREEKVTEESAESSAKVASAAASTDAPAKSESATPQPPASS